MYRPLGAEHHAGQTVSLFQRRTSGKQLEKFFVFIFAVSATAVGLYDKLGIHQNALDDLIGQFGYMLTVAVPGAVRNKPVVKAVPEAADLLLQLLRVFHPAFHQHTSTFAQSGAVNSVQK